MNFDRPRTVGYQRVAHPAIEPAGIIIRAHRPEPVPGEPARDPFTEPQPDDTPGFPPGSRPKEAPIDPPTEIHRL
jgi:hypothetical protein